MIVFPVAPRTANRADDTIMRGEFAAMTAEGLPPAQEHL